MDRLHRFFESITQDLRYAGRTLLKSPAFTAVAVLSITLGIGANTAIFSLIDAVMWRMLPVKDPASLMAVGLTRGSRVQNVCTYKEYRTMREYSQMHEMTAYSPVRLTVNVEGSLEPAIDGQMVAG